jgi:hypothetical protein
MDVDLTHLVLGIEVHLRTMELATLDGFGRSWSVVPLVIISRVLLIMNSRRRWGKIWVNWCTVCRIIVGILLAVCHVLL